MAQMRAANASLKAVEDGIQLHATNRDYGKLKETAEASGLAAKVRASNFCISSVNDASPCMQQYKPVSGMRASQTLYQRSGMVLHFSDNCVKGCRCSQEIWMHTAYRGSAREESALDRVFCSHPEKVSSPQKSSTVSS